MTDPTKILIRMPNWLGDLMMATAFCQAVLERFPEATVDLIIRKGFEGLPLPHRGTLLPFDRELTKAGDFVAELANQGYQRIYVLPPSFSSAWMAWRSRIPERIGYSGDGRRWLLRPAIRPAWQPRTRHLVEEYLHLLSPQDSKIPLVFPQLELSEEWVSEQLRGLPALPKSFIALAPGAIYGPAKQWPEVYYHEVTAQLAQKWNESILILGTPADHASGEKITQGLSGVENWCGRSNLPQLVALLSRAKLLLSNDSGSMHIMAALQRPQLAIFGSTSPTWTRPLNPHARFLYRAEPCSPCFDRTCQFSHTNCLISIQPADALQELENMLM